VVQSQESDAEEGGWKEEREGKEDVAMDRKDENYAAKNQVSSNESQR